MKFAYCVVPAWPRLAWLAVCRPSGAEVLCFVGPGVEIRDSFFCEGVWAGPFERGDLDETDLVFGSGGRVRADGLVFVSAGSTLDRLQTLRRENETLVSNSLPCLLSAADAALDPRCSQYEQIFESIVRGLGEYKREVPSTAGPIRLTYFDNLVWDGDRLLPVRKPDMVRDFRSFQGYRSFLDSSMAALAANAVAAERQQPLSLISTLSAGYDSPTCTVLAREVGCTEAFGFDRAREGAEDSGKEIARALGLDFRSFDTDGWRTIPGALPAFLAGGGGTGADVIFASAEPLLSNRLVFTGFHGDKMWDRRTEQLGPEIVRGDSSGCDLTEYRLSVGFVNCPVPFWGVRQIRQVHAISNSPDLEPWDVGGSYSRPICRRIVEERGVPRELFGTSKKAACADVLAALPDAYTSSFLTLEARREYFTWLRSRRIPRVFHGSGATLPWPGVFDHESVLGKVARKLRKWSPGGRLGSATSRMLDPLTLDAKGQSKIEQARRVRSYVFHWAMERARERYPNPS